MEYSLPRSTSRAPSGALDFQTKMQTHTQGLRGTVELYQHMKVLEEDAARLGEDNARLHSDLTVCRHRCQELEETARTSKRGAEQSLSATRDAVMNRSTAEGKENSEVRAENADLKLKMETMERHARAMASEVETVHKDLLRREGVMAGNEELKRQLTFATAETERLTATVFTQSKDLAKLRPMCERLRETEHANRMLHTSMTRLRSQRRALTAAVEKLNKERAWRRLYVAVLMSMVFKSHRKLRNASDTAIRTARNTLSAAKSDMDLIETDKNDVVAQCVRLEDKVIFLENKLRDALSEVGHARTEVKGSARATTDLTRELEGAWGEIRGKDTIIAELNRSMESVKRSDSASMEQMRETMRCYQAEFTAFAARSQKDSADARRVFDEESNVLRAAVRQMEIEAIEVANAIREEAAREVTDLRNDAARRVDQIKDELKMAHLRDMHGCQEMIRKLEEDMHNQMTRNITLEGELSRAVVAGNQSGNNRSVASYVVNVETHQSIQRLQQENESLRTRLNDAQLVVFSPRRGVHDDQLPTVVVTPSVLTRSPSVAPSGQAEEWRARCLRLDKDATAAKEECAALRDQLHQVQNTFATHLQDSDREAARQQDEIDAHRARVVELESMCNDAIASAKINDERRARVSGLEGRLRQHDAPAEAARVSSEDFHKRVLEAIRSAEAELNIAMVISREKSGDVVSLLQEASRAVSVQHAQLGHVNTVLAMHMENSVKLERQVHALVRSNKDLEVRVWEATELKLHPMEEAAIAKEKNALYQQRRYEDDVRQRTSEFVITEQQMYLDRCKVDQFNLHQAIQTNYSQTLALLRNANVMTSPEAPSRAGRNVMMSPARDTRYHTPGPLLQGLSPPVAPWFLEELQKSIRTLTSSRIGPTMVANLTRLERQLSEAVERQAKWKVRLSYCTEHSERACHQSHAAFMLETQTWAQRIAVLENELDQRQCDVDEADGNPQAVSAAQNAVDAARRESTALALAHQEKFSQEIRDADSELRRVDDEYNAAVCEVFRVHSDMLAEMASARTADTADVVASITKVYTALQGESFLTARLGSPFDVDAIVAAKRSAMEEVVAARAWLTAPTVVQRLEQHTAVLSAQVALKGLERRVLTAQAEQVLQRQGARHDATLRQVQRQNEQRTMVMRREHESALQSAIMSMASL